MRLDNELALITGASRGIGQAIALELGRRGATVIGTATSRAGGERIDSVLAAAGIDGCGLVLDLAWPDSLTAMLAALAERYSKTPVTVLVNNAAITRDALLLRMNDDDWNQVVETNLSGVFRLTKALLRGMLKARRGRIINVASVVASTGNPGQANYAASKAGLLGFTKSLAREVGARGITVNAIAPGFIDTDMTRALSAEQRATLTETIPLSRLGAAEDIAYAAAFLASTHAAYITGETLHVNGGMYMG